MSRSRQRGKLAVRTISVSSASRLTWRGQASEWAQLVLAFRGALTVRAGPSTWIVPPGQSLWIPARTRHHVEVAARVALHRVYVDRSVHPRGPRSCALVGVSPLLRELLRRILPLKGLDRAVTADRHLIAVLRDELVALPRPAIDLPMPRDPRAERAALLVRANPRAPHRIVAVARHAAASPRTLERIFRAETGLPFGAWRQRARLAQALERLAEGATVTSVGLAVGYQSTSAFVAAFRRAVGTTPGRYFKEADRAALRRHAARSG